jgi:hypothetical protein
MAQCSSNYRLVVLHLFYVHGQSITTDKLYVAKLC